MANVMSLSDPCPIVSTLTHIISPIEIFQKVSVSLFYQSV